MKAGLISKSRNKSYDDSNHTRAILLNPIDDQLLHIFMLLIPCPKKIITTCYVTEMVHFGSIERSYS